MVPSATTMVVELRRRETPSSLWALTLRAALARGLIFQLIQVLTELLGLGLKVGDRCADPASLRTIILHGSRVSLSSLQFEYGESPISTREWPEGCRSKDGKTAKADMVFHSPDGKEEKQTIVYDKQ
jgi:hypothetical protein